MSTALGRHECTRDSCALLMHNGRNSAEKRRHLQRARTCVDFWGVGRMETKCRFITDYQLSYSSLFRYIPMKMNVKGAACTTLCAGLTGSGYTHRVKLPAMPCMMLPKTWVQDPTRLQCGGGAREPATPSGSITCEFLPHIMCRRDSTSDSCNTSQSSYQECATVRVASGCSDLTSVLHEKCVPVLSCRILSSNPRP